MFITTHDLAGAERIADRVAVLRQGRIVLDEEMETVKQRFRRLSFPSSEGQPYAETLAALAPVAVTSRGWGIEAVVANYDEKRSGPEGPEVSALTLEEIFIALTGEPGEEP